MNSIFRFSITIVLLVSFNYSLKAQTINKSTSTYDSTLAKSLKADDYGMKKYVMVLLKNGSVPSLPKAKQDSIFGGHMKNIDRLAEEKKLVVAGPFERNDHKYRGIFIFDSNSIALSFPATSFISGFFKYGFDPSNKLKHSETSD